MLINEDLLSLYSSCLRVLLLYLFDLQPVAPDPLQQVTETGDERVLLHASDADLTVTKFHRLPAHLLHQHALCLDEKKQQQRTSVTEPLLQRYPHTQGALLK